MNDRSFGRVACAALLATGVVACSSGDRAEPPGPSGGSSPAAPRTLAPALVAPTNFRSSFADSLGNRRNNLVDWRTAWVLRWDAVPGADGYVVRFATSEGGGGRERRVDTPMLRIDAAAGTSPAKKVDADRATQLTLTASQLLVSVVASNSSGVGPRSGWYRVGESSANGLPVANSGPDNR